MNGFYRPTSLARIPRYVERERYWIENQIFSLSNKQFMSISIQGLGLLRVVNYIVFFSHQFNMTPLIAIKLKLHNNN